MGHVIYTTTGTEHPTIARRTNQLDGSVSFSPTRNYNPTKVSRSTANTIV